MATTLVSRKSKPIEHGILLIHPVKEKEFEDRLVKDYRVEGSLLLQEQLAKKLDHPMILSQISL